MNEVAIAKKIIAEELRQAGINVLKFILFGSRARGDFKKDSDWDFFVIIDKKLDFQQKRKMSSGIRRKLAESNIPNDIIMQAKSIVDARKNNVGYLSYYALKEGMEV